jgi:hypothetical protein
VKAFLILGALFSSCHRVAVPPNTPTHGLVFTIGGLGSQGPVEIWFRFDADKRELLSYDGPYDGANEMKRAKHHALTAADATALWQRAQDVLHAGNPTTHHVSDYTQRIVINNAGDAIDATGDGPFADAAAQQLQAELERLSR